ncbi:uncharacterized protein C16orf46 homolog [Erethizon dorsatum]
MDLCQESKTDLENNENNEIQSPEETELTFTCADERSEKNHVYRLLDISDLTLEEDTRADEFAIGTGWDEAAQGWGKTSPTTCFWPRKKLKKVRRGNSTSSSCLLCVSLSLGSVEARPASEPKKVEAGPVAETSLESIQDLKTQGPFQGLSMAPREAGRVCFPSDIPEGKKSLQVKEFSWRPEDWAIPGVTGVAAELAPTVSNSLTSKTLLVLPPLRASSQNPPAVPSSKSKNFFWQSEEEAPNVDKEESEADAHGLKTVDRKGEQRPSGLAGHRPLSDALPITIPVPVPTAGSLVTDVERCCLRWSLLPERSPGCPLHPSALPCLATLQLLQKRGLQSYRAKLKARGLGAPRNSQKHTFPEAMPEDRPRRVLETKVLPMSLLPALTVRRVVIPVSTHRVL